jgi:hypothetical protein
VGNRVKAKRKQKHIKVKFPKTAPINVGQEGCEKEIPLLGKLSTQSSLQHAAICIGFPTKYFGSSSSIVPHGHGGGSPRSSFIDPANSSQVILTSPSWVTTLPPSDTPPFSRLSPTTTMAKKANSPYKPFSQPTPSNNSSPAPPILQTPISTQPPSTLQANSSDPAPIVAASQTPALSHSSRMLFTYRAQLTFGLSTATEVNVADFFLNWVQQSKTDLPDFVLHPFDTETNNATATEPNEIKHDDITFFQTYYANHCILCPGNLTGMVHFQTTVS